MAQDVSQKQEEQEALAFSALLDGISAAGTDTQWGDLMQTADTLAQLSVLLPAPERAWAQATWRNLSRLPERTSFERRMVHFAKNGLGHGWIRPLALGFTLATVLLAAFFVTEPGQQILLGNTIFNLQSMTVQRAPEVPEGELKQLTQAVSSLDDAAKLVAYHPRQVKQLPQGYELHKIEAVSYQGLPEWIKQPFYLESDYRPTGSKELYVVTLRQFAMAPGSEGQISELQIPQSANVTDTGHLQIAGRPAVYVFYRGGNTVVRELIWQQDDVMLKLLSQTLSLDDLQAIAASVE